VKKIVKKIVKIYNKRNIKKMASSKTNNENGKLVSGNSGSGNSGSGNSSNKGVNKAPNTISDSIPNSSSYEKPSSSGMLSSISGLLGGMKSKFLGLFPDSDKSKNNKENGNQKGSYLNTETLGSTVNAIQEKIIGQGNVLASNYVIIVSLILAFITVLLLYFLSNSFRTSRSLDAIGMYYQYQSISSFTSPSLSAPLANFYISSAYNSALVGYQQFDYVNELILKGILQAGVRYVEFNIFNSEFGISAIPVVSNGHKSGEWKMTLNMIPFDLVCSIIAANAFVSNNGSGTGVPNPSDPLFIGLNLNTNSNTYTLDSMAASILFYFRRRLLDSKYTYQQANMALAPMNDLIGRVIILASDGFQGSNLEELVNGSWNLSNIKRLHYSNLLEVSYDTNSLTEFNKSGLTIVVPHEEGDFWTANYDPTIAWKCGCQLVAMNFQIVDTPMDTYITNFKNFSILPKPPTLVSSKAKRA
jgi:hypothetical protein